MPAARTTCSADIVHWSVLTPRTLLLSVITALTHSPIRKIAPARIAACARAWTVNFGLAWPSVGQNDAASTDSETTGAISLIAQFSESN